MISNSTLLDDIGLINDTEATQSFNDYIQGDVDETISGYVRHGADFEDKGQRPLNHFYDPLHNKALFNNFQNFTSPDWALEDIFETPHQDYSLRDANDYLYQALTLYNKAERETHFGKLFKTLGHVIHHVQDMAQPQHVRNDDHCGESLCKTFEKLDIFNPSLYEERTNEIREKLPYTGYGEVKFTKARDFWYNSLISGLADFSNRNFITIGTNFIADKDDNFSTHRDYPDPEPYPNIFNEKLVLKEIDEVLPGWKLSGLMAFMPSIVTDKRTGKTSINEFSSTLSIFDQDLELNSACVEYTRVVNKTNGDELEKTYSFETCRLFTYNRLNVEAAHPYLIPKAVAYSAGLINHFFRGRLDVTKTEQTSDANNNPLLEITVKNISSNGFDFGAGQFAVFYDLESNKGKREKAEFAAGVDGQVTTLANGDEVTIKLVLPTDIDTDSDNPFVVAYKGIIGEEPGVAGKVFNVKQNTALLAWAIPDGGYTRQLWRSVDYGKTWQVVINGVDDAIEARRIYPVGKGEAFATLIPWGFDRIVYHSTDNGLSWSRLTDPDYSIEDKVRLTLALPLGIQQLSGNMVLLSADSKTVKESNGDVHLAYFPSFSLDKGKTWRTSATPMGLSHVFGVVNVGKGQVLAVGAEYVGTGNCEPGCYFQKFRYALYLSRDYGKYWSRLRYNDAYGVTSGYAVHEHHQAFTDTQRIVGRGDIADMSTLVVSDDLGTTWQHENLMVQQTDWPYAAPLYSVYLGQGRTVSYVYDGSYSYACTQAGCPAFESIFITGDYGQRWQTLSYRTNTGVENDWPGKMDMWGSPTIEALGRVTKDAQLLDSIDFAMP